MGAGITGDNSEWHRLGGVARRGGSGEVAKEKRGGAAGGPLFRDVWNGWKLLI